jgi:ribonuclease III
MEFLGDAVLGLVIAEILYHEFPDFEEGELQKKRASLVNRAALARLLRQLKLGSYIRMGRGDEMSGCRDRDSVLSDTLEALIAAVYLDGGFESARRMIKRHFFPMIEGCHTRNGTDDFKSLLQEVAQSHVGVTPEYRVLSEWGEEHEKTFCVAVLLGDRIAGQGEGRNKKEAAQHAARAALYQIKESEE